MILGNICTRNCRFCAVAKGSPLPLDPTEPERIVSAVKKLGLEYAVITSVTRDDFSDGGASQFAEVIRALSPLPVEVLIPDLQGKREALEKIMEAKPFVLNHNIETIERLYPEIRPQAKYQRSLALLAQAKVFNPSIYTKSGFMVGLGESDEEVGALLRDLRGAGCDIVTIGQYLAPSKEHFTVARYVEPEKFAWFSRIGEKLGFLSVMSGPFVRSSYKAGEILAWKKRKDY